MLASHVRPSVASFQFILRPHLYVLTAFNNMLCAQTKDSTFAVHNMNDGKLLLEKQQIHES